jgi:hypothetical protein
LQLQSPIVSRRGSLWAMIAALRTDYVARRARIAAKAEAYPQGLAPCPVLVSLLCSLERCSRIRSPSQPPARPFSLQPTSFAVCQTREKARFLSPKPPGNSERQ